VAEPLTQELASAFTRPTFQRFSLLLFAAILTTGRRTVTNVLRTVQALAPGHPSSYHRVFSRRRWFHWRLARGLTRFILRQFVPDGPVLICGDDTVDEHRGKKVYGKACHRDAVRSTHSFTAYRWGHKWVVLAILVQFPFSRRLWALPVLVALYYSKDFNQKHRRRHKTPSELMQQLLAVLIHWFPARKFVFAGDGGYGTHPLARFACRHHAHLTLVSRFYPQANLYALPPAVKGKRTGRPRQKGRKLAAPEKVVPRSPRQPLTVACTAGAGGASRSYRKRAIGTKVARAWCRSAGSSFTTAKGRIGTSTSSAPIRPCCRGPSSRPSPAAGRSKPLSRNCAPTWAWRPRAAGAREQCCAWAHVCSACTR
jgi:hypothetical protein